LSQEQNFVSELEKILKINSSIKEQIILCKSEMTNENIAKINKLKQSKEMINIKISNKLDLLCSHIIEKTELLCEDFLRGNVKKQNNDKKTEEFKEEKKRIDFLISFVKK
jgi:hypothetical protein